MDVWTQVPAQAFQEGEWNSKKSQADGANGGTSTGGKNNSKNKDSKEPFISLRKKYKEFCQDFTRQRGDLHLSEAEKQKKNRAICSSVKSFKN